MINDTNVVTIFILSGNMSFVTLGDFSLQHFGQAHHGTGAIKRAGEIKIEEEYTGNIAGRSIGTVLILSKVK